MQRLVENVRCLVDIIYGHQMDGVILDLVMNHKAIELYVFCAFMEDEVYCNLECTSIVTENGDRFVERNVEVMKKKFEPNNLTSSVGKGTVLRFRRRMENLCCFLHFHETREVLMKKQKPIIDRS